ncbi:MAG: CGLD27 family protein [Geitlerinemataceae cyanobacterium]
MKRAFVCPVPEEQQPLNEYQELNESGFFQSCSAPLGQYFKTLAWVAFPSLAIALPVSAASFSPEKYPLEFVLASLAGAVVSLTFAVVRLYLGWDYIRNRLESPTVFYEESGWYDGQTWTKTPEIRARDRLVVEYQIQPIVRRLKRTFLGITLSFVLGTIVWVAF